MKGIKRFLVAIVIEISIEIGRIRKTLCVLRTNQVSQDPFAPLYYVEEHPRRQHYFFSHLLSWLHTAMPTEIAQHSVSNETVKYYIE